MEFWVFLQIVIDAILLVIISFYLIRDRKRQIKYPFEEINEERLRILSESFNEMMHESKRITDDIHESIDKEKGSLQQLFDKLESKKEEVAQSVREADRLLQELQRPIHGNSIKSEINNEKYKRALKLAQEGLSVDDIAETLELPKGEVELILDLGSVRE